MIECTSLSERMPDVVHGRDEWNIVEASHLQTCDTCALEWRIVQAGAALHATQPVTSDMATRVVNQLKYEPSNARVAGSIYWRGGVIGVMAAAASIALVLWSPIQGTGTGSADEFAVESTAMLELPELQRLSEAELESMLSSLQAADDNATGELAPRLGDLTEREMEQLLANMEGE